MKKIKLYGAFKKAKKQADGTIIVKGIASSEAIDGDGEIIKATAIKAALPDYMKFGAIREMHNPIAAGVALKCEVTKDGKTVIEAKIVDPATVKKVEEGVLKGFSIGGRITKRDKSDDSIITGIKLTEISLVDRPCNPEALVNLCKMDSEDEEEKEKEKEKEKEEEKEEEKGEDAESKEDSADDDKEDEKKEDDDDEDKEAFAKLSKEHGTALEKILKLQTELQKAHKRIKKLEAQPAAPKGVLKTIGKGEDVTDPAADAELIKKAEAFEKMDPMQKATTLVQIIHGRR
jgi:hypothetical protein